MKIESYKRQLKRRAASKCRLCDQPKVLGRGMKYCEVHRQEAVEIRKAKDRARANANYVPVKRETSVSIKVEIPTEIRDAYKRAQDGSILKRKYPRYEDLRRAYAR